MGFTISKFVKHTVTKKIEHKFATIEGDCMLDKGEEVTLLLVEDCNGVPYFAVRKQGQGLIIFNQGTFDSLKGLKESL